jgi:hypothetical protein
MPLALVSVDRTLLFIASILKNIPSIIDSR